MHFSSRQAYDYFNFLHIQTFTTKYNFIFQENLICYIILHLFNTFLKVGMNSIVLWYEINMRYFYIAFLHTPQNPSQTAPPPQSCSPVSQNPQPQKSCRSQYVRSRQRKPVSKIPHREYLCLSCRPYECCCQVRS